MDDEEVVLKNSALYTHLLDNGFDDFEYAEIPKIKYFKSSLPSNEYEKNKTENTNIYEDNEHLNEMVESILSSNLVFHDDIVIIKNFDILRGSRSFLKTPLFRLLFHTLAASSVCLICSFRQCKLKPIVCFSSSIAYLGINITKYVHKFYTRYREKARINQLMRNMKELSLVIQKCIKFIQEAQVIALTRCSRDQNKMMLSQDWSTNNVECHNQFMPELRCALFKTLQSIILSLKTSICSLVENFPILKSADEVNFYLAFLNEDELHCSKEQKKSISVDELQKMKYIYLLLQSEFLKRLCLNMNPSLSKTYTIKKELFNMVEKITSNYVQQYSQLKEIFLIFYILEKPNQKEIPVHANWMHKEAYIKICSISHNLQQLLRSSRKIEEFLETSRSENNDHEKIVSTLSEFSEDLKKNYEYSKLVTQDFHDYVSRLKPKSTSNVNSISEIEKDEIANDKTTISVGVSDYRPCSADEIFIGFSIQEQSIEDENTDHDYFITNKSSKLLINELKLALRDKAEEWKTRERIAMQNKNLIDEDEDENEITLRNKEENTTSFSKKNGNARKYSSSESSENESYSDKRQITSLSMGTTFAEKIAFASSQWHLKSEEFNADSDNDETEE